MRVAIVHYWLTGMRGGERVLENIVDLFPDADIFTHVMDPDKISSKLRDRCVQTSFVDRLPFSAKHYAKYLMLMPMALERLDLEGYDLVLSSESGPAKGVISPPNAPHFCYCHSPMRYLWDRYHEYRTALGPMGRFVFDTTAHRMRTWDVTTAARVDHFMANSHFVGQRINKYYRRNSDIVYPPVELSRFNQATKQGEHYLFVSELVPYKRADIAIEAFNKLGRRLLVVGGGSEQKRLEAMAGPNIEFLGRVPDQEIAELYNRARALVFPGLEDFGIVPLEAMACGRPVIAFAQGGALDTVIPGETGSYFYQQDAASLVTAVEKFERELEETLSPSAIAAHARRFSPDRFKMRFLDVLRMREPELIGLPEKPEIAA